MGALDPADQHVGREILRKPGRHDLLPGLRVGILGQLVQHHRMLVAPVPVDRAEIIGAGELAAGPERGVEHRHRHGIALRAVDDIPRHGPVGRQHGHLFGDPVAAAAVEHDQVLCPVDRIGRYRSGHDAVFRNPDILHVAVEPGRGLGLFVHCQLFLHPGDMRQQLTVLAPERKIVPDTREQPVDAPDQLVGTCQQPCLGVVGRVGVIADGYCLEHDEQHHDIDASDKL